MATIALGVGGAFLGSAFGPLGASIGWTLGAALGNALFPEKTQGPRLDDLKLHNSSYGGITPYLWGTMRVAGNIIDEQPEMTEHEETSGGKGGGPQETDFTYSVSFAVRLCRRLPGKTQAIKGIKRVWANGRLKYDKPNGLTDFPMTVYLGTEDQLPDPTLEGIHGVGNVPGYRNVAYVVHPDLPLKEYGNTLPVLNYECFTAEGEIPIRISTFDPSADSYGDQVTGTFDGTTITVWNYHYDTKAYTLRHFLLDGTPTGVDVDAAMDIYTVESTVQNADIATVQTFDSDPKPVCWVVNGTVIHVPITGPVPYGNNNIVQGSFLYCITNPGDGSSGVLRFPMASDVPGFFADGSVAISANPGDLSIGVSDNGKVYVFDGNAKWMYEFDADLVLQHTWTDTDWPGTGTATKLRGGGFVRYNDFFAMSYATGLTVNRLNLIAIGADNTLTFYDQPRTGEAPDFGWDGQIVALGGGYILGHDGVALLTPPVKGVPLSEINSDISQLAGLLTGEIDVTALTPVVDGYAATQQATGREMIQPLRDAWFYDAVERDNKVVFVMRGGDPAVSIPDSELAARISGESAPPILGLTRTQETETPAIINVDFIDPTRDYQTNTQRARRQVTNSQSEVTLTLPINMSIAKAKSVAETHLYMAEVERDQMTIFTRAKYAAYEPTDIITAGGQDIRVTDKSEVRAGVIKFDGVAAFAPVLVQAGTPVSGLDFTTSPPTVVTLPDTTAYLLDLPLVSDDDVPNGFYSPMTGSTGWPGATLMKSSDGTTYSSVVSTSTRAVMGTAVDILGPFYGGNTFDAGNVVTVLLLSGTLESATEDAVLDGANEAVIGDEVIQYKTAELVDDDTYELSGLLRGRLGTEWAMNGHAAGERFAVLPALRAPLPFSELFRARTYKPVTHGSSLAATTAQGFTNTGASLRPYAPVLLGGGTDGSGNVTLQWTRRTRIGGVWGPFTDVPLSETSEAYKIQVWNEDYTDVARILDSTTPSVVYTAAMQVADFGATQRTIFFTVAQVGAVLGTQARGTAVGAGSASDSVLSPIPPYQSPTSGSGVPPPVPGALNLTLTWSDPGNPVTYTNIAGDFDCSHVVVVAFTTPAGTSTNVGTISAIEWVSGTGPVMRTACLSSIAGDMSGTDLGANSRVVSTSITVQFTVGPNSRPFPTPELLPGTMYYLNIKNDNGAGACTCFVGDCDMKIELRKPSGL